MLEGVGRLPYRCPLPLWVKICPPLPDASQATFRTSVFDNPIGDLEKRSKPTCLLFRASFGLGFGLRVGFPFKPSPTRVPSHQFAWKLTWGSWTIVPLKGPPNDRFHANLIGGSPLPPPSPQQKKTARLDPFSGVGAWHAGGRPRPPAPLRHAASRPPAKPSPRWWRWPGPGTRTSDASEKTAETHTKKDPRHTTEAQCAPSVHDNMAFFEDGKTHVGEPSITPAASIVGFTEAPT